MSKVLIVDDEPQYGVYLSDWLTREGHEVKAVTTAEDAIDFGMRWRPSILVADWMLSSQLDGLQVSEAVRAANPNLRTILITGFPSRDLKARAERANVFSFIEKPFSLSEVAGAVRQAADAGFPLLPGQILVVSASPTVLALASDILRAARQETHSVTTADEARRVLSENPLVRVAILDCVAPTIDLGILAAELREMCPQLIVVGSSETDDEERFAALGIDYFLPRFWDASDLHSLLIKRIDRCTCGVTLPLRAPLPGDDAQWWECKSCHARYQAVLVENQIHDARPNVCLVE